MDFDNGQSPHPAVSIRAHLQHLLLRHAGRINETGAFCCNPSCRLGRAGKSGELGQVLASSHGSKFHADPGASTVRGVRFLCGYLADVFVVFESAGREDGA